MTVYSGNYVSQFIKQQSEEESSAIQPNGFDLSVDTIYQLDGNFVLTNGESYNKGNRTSVEPEDGYYKLEANQKYIVVYDEKIKIPRDCVGIVLPRSRLMRCGIDMETALWDSGYEGIGEGAMHVAESGKISKEMRVAQMIFVEAQGQEAYDGSHQSERI